MNDKQVQKAATGSVAIQAQRDAIYNQGISPGQMIEIMDAISRQVQTFSATAKDLIDERLDEFKSTVLEKIATDAPQGAKAFADPDFQHALLQAQTAYARSDASELHSVLIDLVVQRSKQERRNRLTLTLNDAIVKAASLTLEEFSLLSFAFIFQRVVNVGVANLEGIARHLARFLGPLIPHVPRDETAFTYLETHGCIIGGIGGIIVRPSAMEIVKHSYPGIATKGVAEPDMQVLVAPGAHLGLNNLVQESPFSSPSDTSYKVFTPGSEYALNLIQNQLGIVPNLTSSYLEKAKANQPSDEELLAKLEAYEPCLRDAAKLYNETSLRNARLTPVGIALAHAHLTKSAELAADLSIWIK
ncbi:LPO_1073/Vpar_1526 family protein [Ensifer sp. MJa1]|uniref:LPO_1073/Vpar_1526 family protein n=1 Tax=Ensifer sp. MJa1 TaxID=2919888 RepID=UPI00300914FF